MDQNTNNNIPSNLRPISAWGYVGYQILFSIPLVGFILLIVFSFSDSNINRRNFARSYFAIFLLALIFTVIMSIVLIAILAAAGESLDLDSLSDLITINI